MDAIRQGLLAGDEEEGNGGAEVLQTLINFCHHAVPSRKEFSSVRDYLDYRWEDIANRLDPQQLPPTFTSGPPPNSTNSVESSFTWACSKFAIRSTANQENPKLHRFLRRLGDQVSIANDLASYEKEKRRFEAGRASSMINLVHVIMKVERMQAVEAKSMAFAWQLFTENEILQELKGLKARDELSAEDWRFVDACLLAASGNLLTSVVISRYGGEDARIA